MHKNYAGEVVFNSEVDAHFPHLSVRQTLEFAAALRTNRNRVIAKSRSENARWVTEVAMNLFGLTAVQHTVVGNDFVRGLSGGERKVRLGCSSYFTVRWLILCPKACESRRDDAWYGIHWLLGQQHERIRCGHCVRFRQVAENHFISDRNDPRSSHVPSIRVHIRPV